MLTVRVDISNAIKMLDTVKQRQLPFAMANALTQTAKQGQNAMLTRLPYIFTLRNKWTERGITITPARKHDRESYSEVIADRWYLTLQDVGGEKVAHNGHHYIPVPIRENLRVGKTGIIPDIQRPHALIEAGKAFKVQLKDGRLFLFARIGQGHTAIVPVYRLIHEAHIKPVLNLEAIVTNIAVANFSDNFDEAMQEASRMLTL